MSRQLLQEDSLRCQNAHRFRHALSEPMCLTMPDTLPRDARVRPRLDVRKMDDVALAQNMDPSNGHIDSRFVLSTTALEKAVCSALSGEKAREGTVSVCGVNLCIMRSSGTFQTMTVVSSEPLAAYRPLRE